MKASRHLGWHLALIHIVGAYDNMQGFGTVLRPRARGPREQMEETAWFEMQPKSVLHVDGGSVSETLSEF